MSNTMNAADGIADDLQAIHNAAAGDLNGWMRFTGAETVGLIERISRAEQRERVLREALDEIWKYAAYGTATKQKDVRGRQFGAIHAIALGALAAPAPEQPSAPLIVQPSPAGVLVEDRLRNLSILTVEQPLQITCPFCKQRWTINTQEWMDRFADHLRLAHAKEGE